MERTTQIPWKTILMVAAAVTTGAALFLEIRERFPRVFGREKEEGTETLLGQEAVKRYSS